VELNHPQEQIPMISADNSMLPCATKSTSKEVEVVEVVEAVEAVEAEEEAVAVEEEALQEHLSQLVNHKHKLLSQRQQMSKQPVNYWEYLMEQGLKQMLSLKKSKPIFESTKTSWDSIPPSKKSPSLSPSSRDPMSKDGYVTWESGLTGSIPLLTTSLMYGTNSYTNLEANSKILISSDDPKWNSKCLGCDF
jgi:hypothetical protein